MSPDVYKSNIYSLLSRFWSPPPSWGKYLAWRIINELKLTIKLLKAEKGSDYSLLEDCHIVFRLFSGEFSKSGTHFLKLFWHRCPFPPPPPRQHKQSILLISWCSSWRRCEQLIYYKDSLQQHKQLCDCAAPVRSPSPLIVSRTSRIHSSKVFSFCCPSSYCPRALCGGWITHFSGRMKIKASSGGQTLSAEVSSSNNNNCLTASLTVLPLTSDLPVEGREHKGNLPPHRSIKHHINIL